MKIVITGGSRGIGRIIAESLKEEHEVVIISKNRSSLEKTKNEIGVEGHQADVRNYKEVEDVMKHVGKFDVLINCAGILGPVGFLQENDTEEWEETIRVNLIGTVNCCKSSIRFLSENGKIINFSGGGSAFPRTWHTAYAASKAAVVRFTETFAKELEERGMNIRVNVIAPGPHKTDMWKGETKDEEPEQWADKEELIVLIEFLLENENLNGKFIHIKDDKGLLESDLSDDIFTLRRIDDFRFRKKK
ncbi:MAG: SDR family oxidoreductase [Candidatus Aenigmatarchaeota archaeon]|nr:MAG: SDR family oxidoreductase [Candidatus Aenigmarchaeota archaeon]